METTTKHLSDGRWCTFKYTQYFISDECFNFLQGSCITLQDEMKEKKGSREGKQTSEQHDLQIKKWRDKMAAIHVLFMLRNVGVLRDKGMDDT